jgi:CubicO group peptidase (beta-lactamase class C family)
MPDWLPGALEYLPRWIEFQMRLFEQPGSVVAVAHQGRLVLEKALGCASLHTGEGLTPRHRFRVASHSKTFTAAGIMKLRERGTVGLDDRIGQHVAGLHPTLAETRLTQLLSHTSGLVRDGTTGDQWFDRRPFADAEDLSAAFSGVPTIESNTRFKYSNYGYGLLGRLIEAVTGEPYAVWIQREIVDAAALTETTPDMPVPDGIPMASGHSGKLPLGHRIVLPGHQVTNALAPATGFVSTAGDLARFFAQLIPSSPSMLLTVASRREMTRAQWRNPHSALERHYGLGTMSGGARDWWWFGHAGAFQGFLSQTAALPAHDITIAIVTNAIDGYAYQWLAGALHVLATFAKHGAATDAVRDWGGRWWSIWSTTDLVPMGAKVLVANPGLPMPFTDASEITVSGHDQATIAVANGYGSHGETVERIRDGAGEVCELRLAGGTLVPEERIAAELTSHDAGSETASGRRGG